MVLQDPGDTTTDDFAGNPDSSPSPLDTSTFARPLPLPFLGFSEHTIRQRSEATIQYAERRIHRAMTHEEKQALASHLYKMEQTKSYFAAIGLGAGGLRAYKTMSTNRYPFYQPKPEDIKPDKFLFVKGQPLAYISRQSWRFALYFIVGSQVGNLIGQAVAQPLAAQATANEPQLAQFGRDLKAALAGDQTKMREYRNQAEHGSGKEEERLKREHWEHRARSRAPAQAPAAAPSAPEVVDDMSPTAGSDPWSSSSSTWGDLGLSSDSQDNTAPPLQEQASRPRRNRYDAAPERREDDMSPTGGMFQEDVQRQPGSGESAWERLRRGGAPSPSQRTAPRNFESPQREQRESSTLGDSFTFAESDTERKRSQDKAQREFDARIERERQGKDFNNEERRW